MLALKKWLTFKACYILIFLFIIFPLIISLIGGLFEFALSCEKATSFFTPSSCNFFALELGSIVHKMKVSGAGIIVTMIFGGIALVVTVAIQVVTVLVKKYRS